MVSLAVCLAEQERERALVRWIRTCGIEPVAARRVLEVGCGGGGQLLELLRLGFSPENLVGYELLPDRAAAARRSLPQAVVIHCGDAADAGALEDGSFDVVMQSTVFSSLLDDGFQQRLADRMWELVRPGGGVLWYDFAVDNPRNPDVRGVPMSRVRALFPLGVVRAWRVTLAPPLARAVTRIHPVLYPPLNALRVLRTHRLCWIQKQQPTAPEGAAQMGRS
jgi:SAM-dependent methyltransferase